ncbi:MAG: NAD(P)H-dependent flavin oxidoreductase [Gemmatimonadales bacterium]
MDLSTPLTRDAGIAIPVICGAMYPCSNPELVAAVSAAGGIGVVQPVSMTYVHGHDYREGLRLIRRLTDKPIGMNALIEKSSRQYMDRMQRWVDVSLEEGVRFFITSLGNPRWVVDKVAPSGGVVYHDVTERKWAQKAVDGGAKGLICVNSRAGGHAGAKTPEELIEECGSFGLPLVCAGGVGDAPDFVHALKLGYAGVQMGTRFIATTECSSREDYKRAIVEADEADITLTERITGVPLAVIRTPYVARIGTTIGPISRMLFRGRRTKHWMRTFYALRSLYKMKKDSVTGAGVGEYWQAGKSVAGVHAIEPAGDIVSRFARAAAAA